MISCRSNSKKAFSFFSLLLSLTLSLWMHFPLIYLLMSINLLISLWRCTPSNDKYSCSCCSPFVYLYMMSSFAIHSPFTCSLLLSLLIVFFCLYVYICVWFFPTKMLMCLVYTGIHLLFRLCVILLRRLCRCNFICVLTVCYPIFAFTNRHLQQLLLCATQSLFLCDSSGAEKTSPTSNITEQNLPPLPDCKMNPANFVFAQGWQLLALAVSLFLPKNSRLLWYLQHHLQRNANAK